MPEPLMDGYKELWGAVLMQALHDALSDNIGKDAALARHQARTWLDNPDKQFARVCTFAGFDPVAVYQAWRAGRITKPGQINKKNPRRTGVSEPAVPEHEKGIVPSNHPNNGSEPRQQAPSAFPAGGAHQEAAE